MLLRHVLAFTVVGLLALSGTSPAAAQAWPPDEPDGNRPDA